MEQESGTGARRRPVGGTENSWCRCVPGGTGTTVLCVLISHPTSPVPIVEGIIGEILRRHPILRCNVVFLPPGTPGSAVSGFHLSLPASPPSFSLQCEPAPASDATLESIVEFLLNENPWAGAGTGPVFRSALYELPEAGRWVLAFQLHTAAADRTSVTTLFKEMMAGLAGETTGEAAEDEAVLRSGLENLIPQKDSWKPFWARGMDLVGYSINGLRTSTLPFHETNTERSSAMVRFSLGDDDTKMLLEACEANGVKLCCVVAAAVLLAAHSSKKLKPGQQQETFSVVTLVDCRKYLNPVLGSDNFGFYYSAITNTHAVDGRGDLWELARRCSSSYSNALSHRKHLTDIGDLNFLMCKALDNPHLTHSSALRTAAVSVFEEPAILEPLCRNHGLKVEDFVCCASIHGVGPSVAVFDAISGGRLHYVLVYPIPLHSRAQMQEVAARVEESLLHGIDGDGSRSAAG